MGNVMPSWGRTRASGGATLGKGRAASGAGAAKLELELELRLLQDRIVVLERGGFQLNVRLEATRKNDVGLHLPMLPPGCTMVEGRGCLYGIGSVPYRLLQTPPVCHPKHEY